MPRPPTPKAQQLTGNLTVKFLPSDLKRLVSAMERDKEKKLGTWARKRLLEVAK